MKGTFLCLLLFFVLIFKNQVGSENDFIQPENLFENEGDYFPFLTEESILANKHVYLSAVKEVNDRISKSQNVQPFSNLPKISSFEQVEQLLTQLNPYSSSNSPTNFQVLIHFLGAIVNMHYFDVSIIPKKDQRVERDELKPYVEPPASRLRDAIEKRWGTYTRFFNIFQTQSVQLKGAGWAILYFDVEKSWLELQVFENHQTPALQGHPIILSLNLWEHSHMLDYGYNRGPFLNRWWMMIDWDSADRRYQAIANLYFGNSPAGALRTREKEEL